MLVLGIETSCDETAASVVESGKKILSNVIFSQADAHQQFGGVFPELASRHHADLLLPVIAEALKKASVKKEELDLIAVTNGPGLMGALLIGLNAAKSLSYSLEIPFVGVNHVEAHLYSAMMSSDLPRQFPALGIVVSGGHTFLTKINDVGSYEMIATTVDDAVGEAFDKVASMMSLPYPGGPEIEKLARSGEMQKYSFKSGVVKGRPLDFSFSGLKTNVLYTLKGPNSNRKSPLTADPEEFKHIAASFQHTALSDVVSKSLKAAKTFNCQAIYIGGGVSQNQYLRELFELSVFPIFFPKKILCLDNAAMIAGLGYHVYQRQKKGDPYTLKAFPRISSFF